MDPRLKRIAVILPALIIVGVYTNFIPVGPDLKGRINNIFSKEEVKQKKEVFAIVEKIQGEVLMREKPSFPTVALKGGELLKEGATITTGENSGALLTYRSYYHWEARLSSNTQINIDELMKLRPEDTTVFNLVSGAVSLRVKNSSGKVRNMNVRTKFASFGVIGTTFAVLTDGEKRSLMTVNEGIVMADNYKLSAKTKVLEGHTYLVNREGESKVILNLGAVNLYDWELQNLENEIPSINDVISQTGDVGPTLDDQERAKLNLLKDIDGEISEFKNTNKELLRELENLHENAVKSREGLKLETVNVDKDIRCLQTSKFECNLFTEKILVARGYPRMWGNPRYRSGLVVELQKYLIARNDEVSFREDEAKILSKLMSARNAVVKQMEEDRKEERNLDKIIPTLQDARLRR